MKKIEDIYPNQRFRERVEQIIAGGRSAVLSFLSASKLIQKSRNFIGSDEYCAEIGGIEVFVKSFAKHCWPLRFLYGRRTLKNEFHANRRMHDIGMLHVAEPYCWLGKDTALFEFIRSCGILENPKHHKDFTVPSPMFFEELIGGLRAMHKHGIAHGDIRRTNILVGEDGHPWLVDTASAVMRDGGIPLFNAIAFHILRSADMFALAKIVYSYYPDWEDAELRKAYDNAPWYLVLGRYVRHYLYPLVRHKHRHSFSLDSER